MGVFEEVLGVVEKLWGPDDTTMIAALERMGLMFYSRGRYLEAEKLFRREFYTRKKKLGKAKCTIQAVYKLGAVLIAQDKQTEEMVEVFLYALDGLGKARWLGDAPRTFFIEDPLANVLLTLEMYEEAEKVLKDNLEDRKRVLGEVYRTLKVAQNLGFALLRQEKLEAAEDFFW
jgi:tetratricopeptide (TPR) repeat protein